MAVRHLRLALGVFFICMAALLFLREELAPAFAEKMKDRHPVAGAWFALVLAGWNLSRWYTDWSARRAPAGQNPLAVRTHGREQNGEEEPNPDFDFTGGQPHPPAGPSPNGDHRG
jgi:hypothetical protein